MTRRDESAAAHAQRAGVSARRRLWRLAVLAEAAAGRRADVTAGGGPPGGAGSTYRRGGVAWRALRARARNHDAQPADRRLHSMS